MAFHFCPRVPIGPPTAENMNLKVSAPLTPDSNDWNTQAIRHHLPHLESTIRSLIPSSRKRKDSLVWLPEKSRSHSTKTGYILAKLNSSALDLEVFNWQLNIWSLSVSPRLRCSCGKLNDEPSRLEAT